MTWAIVIGYAIVEGKDTVFRVVDIDSKDQKGLIVTGAIMKEGHLFDKYLPEKNIESYVEVKASIHDFEEAKKAIEEIGNSKFFLWDFVANKGSPFDSAQKMVEFFEESLRFLVESEAKEKTKTYIS